MNENYKDFVTICIFLFQSARSQAAEGRLRGRKGAREGWIDEQSYQIDQYEARVLLCTHVYPRRPAPRPGS